MQKKIQKRFFLSQRQVSKLANLHLKTNEHSSDLVARAIDQYEHESEDSLVVSRVNMVLGMIDNLDIATEQIRVFLNRLIGELIWRI